MVTQKKRKNPATKKESTKKEADHHPIAKRYLFIVLGVVVVISLMIVWYGIESNPEQDEEEVLPSYSELTTNDTDNDGIPDWRELLMGTNPLAYDTNSDGVGDETIINTTNTILASTEIARLREEYPDATEEELLAISRAANDPSTLNVTERMSRDLYVAGEVMNRMGILTPEVRQGISDEYINELIYEYEYPLRISTDFEIVSNASSEEVFLYLENAFSLVNDTSYLEQDPLLILENALETEDQNLLEKGLDTQMLRQTTLINNLDTMIVPILFAREHENLVNALVRITVDTSDIQRFFDDSMRGYAAILRYQPNLLNYQEALDDIGNKAIAYADQQLAALTTSTQ